MEPNPGLGVAIFSLGGLAGAVFYLPFKRVRNWAWESYWLVYAVAGLIVVPWALALSTAPNLLAVLKSVPLKQLAYCFCCGALWGVGGLSWGLMIRYLGVGLGLAIGCGLVSATGTLVPPILAGHAELLYATLPAKISLAGVVVSILGIVLVGMAGICKEQELPEEQKKKAVADYNFKLGLVVALFSGITSAALNFGLQGSPLSQLKAQYGSATQIVEPVPASPEAARTAGLLSDKGTGSWFHPAAPEGEQLTAATWRGMPVLVVALAGGFVVNFLWCLLLNLKNRTLGDYCRPAAPLVANFFFAAVAGAIWCSQFICLKTGEPAMGKTAYIGLAVLMGSQILFSSVLGVFLGEWKGTSGRTRWLLAAGLLLLLASPGIGALSGYAKQL